MSAAVALAEIWQAVPGIPYEASSLGRIRRVGRTPQVGRLHTNGYIRASVSAGGTVRDDYAHRLVCLAFHGQPSAPDHHADHINGNRADNRPSNLRWLSPSQNRALRRFATGAAHSNAQLTESDVREIRELGFRRGQDSELAARFGVSRETIRDVRLRKVWRSVQ